MTGSMSLRGSRVAATEAISGNLQFCDCMKTLDCFVVAPLAPLLAMTDEII